MDYLENIIEAIEVHSVEGIKESFRHGISPNAIFRNEPLIYELTSEYARSPRFKDCVRAFVEFGLILPDHALLSVLLDDSGGLEKEIKSDPAIIKNLYTLRSAYTPLFKVPLLHICAEFNHQSCAEVLVNHGADINALAGVDEHGFGGQTAVFHTVNQNSNNSEAMLDYLVSGSADLEITVKGLIWGKGYPWETLVPAVNPISYAMMGLLPQMHRNEMVISTIIMKLLKARYGIDYKPENIPCAYLKK